MSQRPSRPSARRPRGYLNGDGAGLTDEQWAVLEPLLPRGTKPGRPPERTKRQLIEGIPVADPDGRAVARRAAGYGPWQTVYGLFRRLAAERDLAGDPGRPAGPRRCGRADQVITAGQRGDSPQFQVVLGRIRVPRPGRGRPRTRPRRVLADKAYGSRASRACLRRRGTRCTIPEKADQVRHRQAKGRRGGRPPAFDPEDYKARHGVDGSYPAVESRLGPGGSTVSVARKSQQA
jgi:transposase